MGEFWQRVSVLSEGDCDRCGEHKGLAIPLGDDGLHGWCAPCSVLELTDRIEADADARITELREAITGALDALACTQYSQHAGGLSPREALVKIQELLRPHRITKGAADANAS